jgi:hypothetical protein
MSMRERLCFGIAALFCLAMLFGAAQVRADDEKKSGDVQTVTLKISGMG